MGFNIRICCTVDQPGKLSVKMTLVGVKGTDLARVLSGGQGCGDGVGRYLGRVGVGKNVPTLNLTSISNLK
jgi:hypothetical protein